jgi:hypothetical protein
VYLFKVRQYSLISLLFFSLTSLTNAELLVIAHQDFSRDSIGENEAKDLFLGKLKELDSEFVTPVDQDDDSVVKESFFQKVTRKNQRQLNSHWSRMIFSGRAIPLQSVGSDEDVIAWVAMHADAIGYIDAESLNEEDPVKVLLRVP